VTNVLIATVTIFFSLILGAVALVFVSIQAPEVFSLVLDAASWLERQIGSTSLDVQYNNWVRFLIGAGQLTFMFFVIVTRIVLAILMTAGRAVIGGT